MVAVRKDCCGVRFVYCSGLSTTAESVRKDHSIDR